MYENINVVEVDVKNGKSYFEAYHKRYRDISASGSTPAYAVDNLEKVFDELGYTPFIEEIGVLNELEGLEDFSKNSELMYHANLLRDLYTADTFNEDLIIKEVYALKHFAYFYELSDKARSLVDFLYKSVFYMS